MTLSCNDRMYGEDLDFVMNDVNIEDLLLIFDYLDSYKKILQWRNEAAIIPKSIVYKAKIEKIQSIQDKYYNLIRYLYKVRSNTL